MNKDSDKTKEQLLAELDELRKKSKEQEDRLKAANQQLDASNFEFRESLIDTLENMSDGFVSLDENWYYTYVNKKAGEMFGRKPEDLVGKNIWTEFPEGIGQPFYKNYYKAVETQKEIHFEDYYQPWDRWFENRVFPSKKGLSIFFHDTTESKQSEEALRDSELLLRQIAANYPNSYLSIIEKDFTIGFTSGQEFSNRNLDPEQYIGLSVEQVFGENAPKIKAMYQKAFNGETAEFEMFIDNQHQLYQIVPLADEKGNIDRILAVVRNETERKQAEEALRETETRLKEAELIAKMGNFIWDIKSGDVTWSDGLHELLGYDKSEKIDYNKVNAEIHHPDDLERITAWLNECIASGKTSFTPNEYRLLRKDGKVIHVQTTITVSYKDNVPFKMFGAVQDVSERKEAEEKIKATNQQLRAAEKQLRAANQQLEASNEQLISKEKALKESEENYRLTVENLQAGMVVHSSDGSVLFSNPKATDILGLTQEQMLGKELIDPSWSFVNEDLSIMKVEDYPVSRVIATKQKLDSYLVGIKTKERDYITWVVVNAKPIFSDNELDKIIVNFVDITNRKQAEEGLKESEERYRSVSQSANDAIISSDYMGIIINWNKGAEKIFGYIESEIIGKNLTEIMPHGYRKQHNEGMKRVNKGGEHRIIGNTVELVGLHKNGKKFPIELSLAEWETSSGKFFTGVIRDITERKRNEQIQSIIHHVSNAVITSHSLENFLALVKDELGRLIDTTNFFVALYDEETDRISLPLHQDERDRCESFPTGKTMTHYVIKTGKPLLAKKAMIEKLIKTGEVEQVGHPSKVWLGVPLKSTNKITGIFAVQSYDNENAYDEADVKMLEIISDQISLSLERVKAEEDLKLALKKAQESDRLKTAFLNNMSHEIRTPLNGITGFINLLQDSDIDDEEKQEYFDIINKSSDRLIATVTDIIDISRIEAGEVNITKTEVSVNEILEEQYTFFFNEAKSKGLELIYKPGISDTESHIITDKHKLEGILTNLIKNAVKYTDTGKITMGCRLKDKADGKFIEFYVKDTGIGVPADRIDAIFNRFEQADIADTRAFQGSGLGLAISKSYAEMLGGKISVKSTEGEGSTFTCSIPYEKQHLKVSGVTQNKEEESGISLKNVSVIVAEDDVMSRMYFEAILTNVVKKITFAITGKEAIEKFRENPDTDIILMDIKMPVMNGYDATREIRKFNKDVIIVAQTAYGMLGDKEKAIEAGCDDYIAKPVMEEILFEKIRAWVDKKSM